MQLDLEFPKIDIAVLDEKGNFIYTISSYFNLPRLDEVEYYCNKTDNKHYGRVRYKVISYCADLEDNYPDIYITVDTTKNLLDDK